MSSNVKTAQDSDQKHINCNRLATMMNLYHTHDGHLTPNQCTSNHVQKIDAPLALVWSVVRQFGNPQAYKQFIKSCTVSSGDGGTGSVREVNIISGLPAKSSTERLDRLDDDLHIMVFSIIGGDHRLRNYQSTMTLHLDDDGKTVVVESYVVDVPADSCKEDTCCFADYIIGFNLTSLATITEKMAREVPP